MVWTSYLPLKNKLQAWFQLAACGWKENALWFSFFFLFFLGNELQDRRQSSFVYVTVLKCTLGSAEEAVCWSFICCKLSFEMSPCSAEIHRKSDTCTWFLTQSAKRMIWICFCDYKDIGKHQQTMISSSLQSTTWEMEVLHRYSQLPCWDFKCINESK